MSVVRYPYFSRRPMTGVCRVELTYFDVHARGEVVRLLYAACARGTCSEFVDTRLPLFFSSPEANAAWASEHKPRAPTGQVPYLTVTADDGGVRRIAGGAACASFVARRVGLLGDDDVDAAVCEAVLHQASSPLTPRFTRMGLRAQCGGGVEPLVAEVTEGEVGAVLGPLERYCAELLALGKGQYLVCNRMTLADIAVFNTVDMCVTGPRPGPQIAAVAHAMREKFPTLMALWERLMYDLEGYLAKRATISYIPLHLDALSDE